MNREPDWEALQQLNFLLTSRISGGLNEAMNALSLAEMADSKVDPQIWRDKSRAKMANLLNLYEAWSALIQYKNGFQLPSTAMRPFPVQSLLDWLTMQLELVPPAHAQKNMQLNGNQACIQEALWLLYTVAYTQGSNVNLQADLADNGYWFRIRFMRRHAIADSLDDLIEHLEKSNPNWRNQEAAFELRIARDFIRMNKGDLEVRWREVANVGEFAFFVYKAGADRDEAPGVAISPNVENARFVANVTRSMINPELLVGSGDTTKIVPSITASTKHDKTVTTALDETQKSTKSASAQPAAPVPAIADPQEGADISIAESKDSTVIDHKEMSAEEASEKGSVANAIDTEQKRGAVLLAELKKLDIQNPTRIENAEDLTTASFSAITLANIEKERDTKIGKSRIISVEIATPDTPTILKETPPAQAGNQAKKS